MSGSEYSYDEQGQFFPFFILTLTGLVTIPLTWSFLAPSSDPSALAPRIKTDYRPQHADLVDELRAKHKRKTRRIKRLIFVVVGWSLMAFMVYLITVMKHTAPKLWNPYDILGIPDVSSPSLCPSLCACCVAAT